MTFVVFVAVLLLAFPLEHAAVEVMRSAALTRMPRRGCMHLPFRRSQLEVLVLLSGAGACAPPCLAWYVR
jgi:hypothetical protein